VRLIVIGSGPTGVACAGALAERGHEVTILDAGRGPDESTVRRYAPLSTGQPASWDRSLIEELRNEFRAGRDELPPKPVLGSLHPYAPEDPSAPPAGAGVGVSPSLGRGGLSAVWGAAMLPYRDSDLTGWPFGLAELAPFYESVLSSIPLAARRDRLEAEFPLYADAFRDLEPTGQIRSLLADLERAGGDLERSGITAGRARLAVRTEDDAAGRACRYSGLCLHGCPLGSIWSAAQTLEGLRKSRAVQYLPGRYVERVEENSTGVDVHFSTNGDLERTRADRVFVGSGVLPTARLLLRSLDAAGEPVELLDSQYYTFPLLRLRGAHVSVERQGNTLAQAFLEVNDRSAPSRSAHIQVYGYSDLMLREAAATMRLPPRVAERLAGPLLSRLLFCQGYLHSDRSRSIRAELDRDDPRGPLRFTPLGSPAQVETDVRSVLARLRAAARSVRALPLGSMLRIWEPGRGMHVGGSFPMSATPTGLQSDLLGRPAGLRRIHLVDASVFPSVPPTTITLTAMANARRIAARFASE
jgi:choline dehydrogenase-like flavoprotein